MKVVFTYRKHLEQILSSQESLLVADQLGTELLRSLGLSPHVTVESPNVAVLEKEWEKVLRRDSSRLVAVGGWAAASSAKALSLRRRGSLRLREMFFEDRTPARHVVTLPLDLGFCTTVSELSLVWDPLVPTYYVVRLDQDVVLPLEEYEKALAADPEQYYALSRDAQLLGLSPPPPSGRAYNMLGFCLGYALRGPGPFFAMVLSLAALSGRTPLEASGVLRSLSSGGECPDWLLRLARRKLDYLAEHAWSYYSLFFARAGLRSRYEAFKFLRSELRGCLQP
uniref:Uncharacterized protein n=1 Tax=Thermofilum pendens TaxID=2269 RepID=A0A7C3WJ13_THEPE